MIPRTIGVRRRLGGGGGTEVFPVAILVGWVVGAMMRVGVGASRAASTWVASSGGTGSDGRTTMSARLNSSAVRKRFPGRFSSAFMTMSLSCGGICGTSTRGAIGGSLIWRIAIATGLSPSNGTRPVSIS